MNYLPAFDVDEKVKILQKIRSKERNRDWSNLNVQV